MLHVQTDFRGRVTESKNLCLHMGLSIHGDKMWRGSSPNLPRETHLKRDLCLPSISPYMKCLCLMADRISQKGLPFLLSLFKMKYNGLGLISVSKCIFSVLSLLRDLVYPDEYVQN